MSIQKGEYKTNVAMIYGKHVALGFQIFELRRRVEILEENSAFIGT